jgi:chromosome partitioning protein
MARSAQRTRDGLGPTGRPLPVFGVPGPRSSMGPADIVALCNQKGGVGKTTTTINLGAALAEYGRRVLLVDFDPQGALGAGLGIHPHTLEHTIYDVMITGAATARDVIRATSVPGMDVLPANIDLSGAELLLVSEVGREQALARALRPVRHDYDVILIDCQPSLGLLTVNALTAAQWVIIPLECEYFSLRGVALLQDTIVKIQERTNPDLQLAGVLPTMLDRTVHAREVLERVVEKFDDRAFHTVINRTVKFPETTVAGVPITTYAPTSAAARSYRQLAREVLARIDPGSVEVTVGAVDPGDATEARDAAEPSTAPGPDQLALGG